MPLGVKLAKVGVDVGKKSLDKMGDAVKKSGNKIDSVAENNKAKNPHEIPGYADAEAGGASYYDRYRKENGDWDWPEELGFAETPAKATLDIGTRIDRFGKPDGSFLSPEGIPSEQRALAPGSLAEPYNVYEVMRPMPVIQGKIAPAFGQPGGGVQILPNFSERVNVDWLLHNGYIRKVN